MSKKNQLSAELLQFYDEFAEFHDWCAFYCEAVAGIVSEHDTIDRSTLAGLCRYSGWLKGRGQSLREQLRGIHERSRQ